ncbi:MAG: LacI family transcriptional regulator, partial [Gammaproteobacteria bacterium]|nr:LacI family transcriptional regulator [Gammaproteobacteria bacterium]
MAKATIDDVADLAGVSIKTVSRVINDEPNVRESTREKVEQAIARLNYRPNLSARNLASHRSHMILLVYDDPSAYVTPSSGYIIRLQEGTLKACKQANCDLLIHPCNYRNSDVKDELRILIERTRPDGVVIAAPLSNMASVVNAIAGTDTPYV